MKSLNLHWDSVGAAALCLNCDRLCKPHAPRDLSQLLVPSDCLTLIPAGGLWVAYFFEDPHHGRLGPQGGPNLTQFFLTLPLKRGGVCGLTFAGGKGRREGSVGGSALRSTKKNFFFPNFPCRKARQRREKNRAERARENPGKFHIVSLGFYFVPCSCRQTA